MTKPRAVDDHTDISESDVIKRRFLLAFKLYKCWDIVNASTSKTPLEPQFYLPKASDDDEIDDFCDLEYALLYQELIGALNHLAIFTRPDLSYAVSMLAQFNSNPLKIHWKAALRVLRYLKLTRNFCITYRRGRIIIIGFSDAD